MSLILSGTDGLSDIDGSASTPAIRGTDANTGIFFPAADTIAFAEGGAEVARIDSSGNLLVGRTSSPSDGLARIAVVSNSDTAVQITKSGIVATRLTAVNTALAFGVDGVDGATERMRIDSSGNVLVGISTFSYTPSQGTTIASGSVGSIGINHANGTSSGNGYMNFVYNTTAIGSITQNGTTAVAYNTSSDYRLKENIAPMTGALDVVQQLKPVTYNWKADGSAGQGFIAHELAEVVPDCVTGEKDAVDEDGNPKYQGVDTSFLVATLTAAIQELKGIVDIQAAKISELEAKLPTQE